VKIRCSRKDAKTKRLIGLLNRIVDPASFGLSRPCFSASNWNCRLEAPEAFC